MLKESDDLVLLGVTFDFKMTFEKRRCSVSRAASRRLGILRNSWQVFHNRLLLGRCFRGFVLPVLDYCFAVWCSAVDTHLELLDRVVSGASFLTRGCLSVTFHIVDLWLYYVCCTRSCIILCTLCRCVLPTMLWSHICVLMRLLTAEHRSTAGLLLPCQYLCGTISVTPYSMVSDWRVSRAGPMPFYWLYCSLSFCLLLADSSLFFHSMSLYCGAGFFGQIGC